MTSASNPLSSQGRAGIEHLECMASESDLIGEGEIPIPCDRKARAQAAMNNPVAYVSEYRDMLYDVLVILLGVPPQNFTTVMDHRQTRKTRYFKDRGKGIIGNVLAYYGTNEDHLKGTLHFHLAIYGGIGPDVLQDYATVQEICDAISETLDSTHNTFIPDSIDSIHVEHQMRDVMEEHRKPYEPSRCD